MSGRLLGLARGAAQLLADAEIGAYDDSGGVYPAGETAITVGAMPDQPDDVTCVLPYVISDDVETADSVIALRLRSRSVGEHPGPALDRDEACFDVLEGLEGRTVGGVYVVAMWRQSAAEPTQDKNRRWEAVSTYYARVDWPTQHRTD